MKSIAKYICITLLVLVLAAVYLSRTVENLTLTSVTMMTPFKGTIVTEDSDFIQETVRVRAMTELVIEDVYIEVGDTLETGDPVASVYPAAAERALAKADGEALSFLTKLRDDDYLLTADAPGDVTEVPVKNDTTVKAEEIVYKYIPEDAPRAEDTTTVYDVIVPLSVLTPLADEKYAIYYAVPLTGKGEEGQYQVIRHEVKLLASDDKYAALDTAIWDDRLVIVSADKPIAHMQKVKAE